MFLIHVYVLLVYYKYNNTLNGALSKPGFPRDLFQDLYFFIIFINNIVTEIHSSIKLFADDTSLYVIVDNPRESAITLNNDMTTIHAWSTKWLVNFNPQKTETMTITRKINKPL